MANRLKTEADRWVQALGLVRTTATTLRAAGHEVDLSSRDGALVLRLDLGGLRALVAALDGDRVEISGPSVAIKPNKKFIARNMGHDIPAAPNGSTAPAGETPAAKPKRADTKGGDGAAAGVSKSNSVPPRPWTDEEIARATDILREGGTNADVAQHLRRGVKHVASRCAAIRKALRHEGPVAPEPRSQPDPTPAPAQEAEAPAPPPAARSTSSPAGVGSAETVPFPQRQAGVRLDALNAAEPWPPARDLALVAALIRGDGLSAAAEAAGVDRDAARARWQGLVPPPVTLKAQEALLAELQRRVKMEG